MEVGYAFVGGVIVGILLTFFCLKMSFIMPAVIMPTSKSTDEKKSWRKKLKPKWNPGSLVPPGESSDDLGGPGPSYIGYDNPADLLDPVDPKKHNT